ncbi:hypothetical protein MMC07_000466 [Pseudocyphellaria aurata]|nr:hypothetical protein [Pseudocyphellaria aurata]
MSPNSTSSSSSPTEGPAFPWILDHLLNYPGSYEIPLRTMYTLNATPQGQALTRQSIHPGTPSLSDRSSFESAPASPASPSFPPEKQNQYLPGHDVTEHFKSCLMTHISRLPSQPFSLPPKFITSFVRRCFTDDLCLVDFTQALTALDYLKDLENRRKRELTLVLHRLGLDKDTLEQAGDAISRRHPKIAEWLLSMQTKEKKVEALYTQVYIGLRRWTLINEMRLEPFSKANSIAMLNTLYPPTTAIPPTRLLTPAILQGQRHAFFRYITGVEKNGKGILHNIERQGMRPTDENGWPSVRDVVDKYLRTANSILEEYLKVTGPEHFTLPSEASRGTERRADSGVSFATGDRPSTSGSSSSRTKLVAPYTDKPLPASPPCRSATLPPVPQKTKSKLEKIMGNFRSRNDVKEIAGNENRDRLYSLKKMKSASSLGGSRAKHARSGSWEKAPFEIDDAKRQRLIQEAQKEKENRVPQGLRAKGKSHEV